MTVSQSEIAFCYDFAKHLQGTVEPRQPTPSATYTKHEASFVTITIIIRTICGGALQGMSLAGEVLRSWHSQNMAEPQFKSIGTHLAKTFITTVLL